MIKTASAKTAKFLRGEALREFRPFFDQAVKRLGILDDATSLEDLAALPSNRLERLRGDRKGQYSIRINAQWRICFRFEKGNAYDVEIVDYH